MHKNKWLLCWAYNTNKNSISNELDLLRKTRFRSCKKILILGDFNVEFNRTCPNTFCDSHSLKSFFKKPACFKNPENPDYIDLMLTNSPNGFQNLRAIETGLSDVYKMTATVMKMKSEKLNPREEHLGTTKLNFFQR